MAMDGMFKDGTTSHTHQRNKKFKPLIDAPFLIGDHCCDVMKKQPLNKNKVPKIIGTMACESALREVQWLAHGCNIVNEKTKKSMPMSFWKEQDVLQYIKIENLEIASVYGDVVCIDGDGNDCISCFDCSELRTTGCQRTGCVFCAYGAHLDKGIGRFVRLKTTHPKLYNYCINGGAFDPEDGLWKPTKQGLGMGFVFDWCNENIKNFKIEY